MCIHNAGTMKGKVELTGMEFHARHGCLETEQLVENLFIVDFEGVYDMGAAAESDDLEQAVNYALVYDMVADEMGRSRRLLEHLCASIVNRIAEKLPQLERFSVKVSKQRPPVDGIAAWSSVTIEWPYEQ